MYQQSKEKKWERRKQKKAMLWESDFQEHALIIRNCRIFHCPKRVTPWNHSAALAAPFVFILWKCVAFLSFCPLLTTTLKPVRLERDFNTVAFPLSSSSHTVNARCSVISLAGDFSRWHIPPVKYKIFRRRKLAFVSSVGFCRGSRVTYRESRVEGRVNKS